MSGMEFYRRLSMGMPIDRCYDLEYARFFSFSKCPPNFLPNISYIKLAAAGLYFDNGQCKCHKCGIYWKDNHSNRDPMEVHRQISPSCHFACSGMMEISSANVNCLSIGIRRSSNVVSQNEPRGEQTRTKGRRGNSLRSRSLLDTGYSSSASSTPIQEEGQQCSNEEESHNDFRYTDYSPLLHKQPLTVPKKIGAVAYSDEVLKDLDIDLTSTSGSTNIISGGNTHPYLASTATRAVLEIATGQNKKQHVEKILNALCSENDIHVERINEPNAAQIYGVLLIMEEYEEELKKRDNEIEKRDIEIKKLERKQLTLNNELEDSKSGNTQIYGICCTEVRNMVFFPCGHVFCCEQCFMRLQRNSPQNQRLACPTCRRPIERSVKIFWS
ncbi:Hypothetical predicted protein [Mytilus galloprovincialis]|uniref:RING-type domain-containing protein n=1 Tax=Mytilus galloprovincialis TaxID=29158 RepID=A0A8B6BZH6_MYTGA|nr:Hypothetical predicted protein [Mytilus galloprovincialis]